MYNLLKYCTKYLKQIRIFNFKAYIYKIQPKIILFNNMHVIK